MFPMITPDTLIDGLFILFGEVLGVLSVRDNGASGAVLSRFMLLEVTDVVLQLLALSQTFGVVVHVEFAPSVLIVHVGLSPLAIPDPVPSV